MQARRNNKRPKPRPPHNRKKKGGPPGARKTGTSFSHRQEMLMQRMVHKSQLEVVEHFEKQRQTGENKPFVAKVQPMISERKYLMTGASGALTVSPVFTSVTDVPQGTGDTNRLGDRLRILSLHLKLEFVKNLASTAAADYCRVVVVQTHSQFTLAPPTGTTLFLNDPITASINYRSEWIVDGTKAYTVLHDKTYTLAGFPSGDLAAVRLDKYIRVRRADKEVQYINASTTDALNKIFVGVFSNISSTNIPNVAWGAKFNFADV